LGSIWLPSITAKVVSEIPHLWHDVGQKTPSFPRSKGPHQNARKVNAIGISGRAAAADIRTHRARKNARKLVLL
jgi:hypothetical protein